MKPIIEIFVYKSDACNHIIITFIIKGLSTFKLIQHNTILHHDGTISTFSSQRVCTNTRLNKTIKKLLRLGYIKLNSNLSIDEYLKNTFNNMVNENIY